MEWLASLYVATIDEWGCPVLSFRDAIAELRLGLCNDVDFPSGARDAADYLEGREQMASKQFTLGDLVNRLRTMDPKLEMAITRLRLRPTGFTSYRGDYSQLALTWTCDPGPPVLSGELFVEAESCMGKKFEGYKGGTYTMGAHTPLWLSRIGESSDMGIIGLYQDDGYLYVKFKGMGY